MVDSRSGRNCRWGGVNVQRSLHLQNYDWDALEQGTEPSTAPRALQYKWLRVCVHCCVCALGWVKCRALIPSMGHHMSLSLHFTSLTWPYSVNIKDIKVTFSQNVLYTIWRMIFCWKQQITKKITFTWFSLRGSQLHSGIDFLKDRRTTLRFGTKCCILIGNIITLHTCCNRKFVS